jgi:hypothetical protein
MGVFVILLIIGIVAYLIYQSLPTTKFEKAQTFFNTRNYFAAIGLLNEIFDKHHRAPSKLAECKLILAKNLKTNSDKLKALREVVKLRSRIKNYTSISMFVHIETKALFEIAAIQFEEAGGDVEAISLNLEFIDNSNQKGLEKEFSSLKTKHFMKLAESYFNRAIDMEKGMKLKLALKDFKKAIEYSERCNNANINTNSATRILICRLKLNESIEINDFTEIQKSNKDYQKDLFYRYSVHLIRNGQFHKANDIVSNYFSVDSPVVEKLHEILKSERINKAIFRISQVNKNIELIYSKSLDLNELKLFYDSIDTIELDLRDIDLDLSQKVLALKPTLFNRLLSLFISLELYGDAITIIQNFTNFWESPELLKNLGICCYNFTLQGFLTKENYKNVISGWLTSLHSDNVILKSLEDTSWDDNYTFTLAESIGSNYSQHGDVPDNVNYDEVSEYNISIGSTQKELLLQFENIIQNAMGDSKLAQSINDFYFKEKESLESIINILTSDILFPTPHFAITNNLNNDIIRELDSDYEQYANEESLEAGLPYIKNSTSSKVYQYFYANDLILRVKSAIEKENLVALKKLNTLSNKKWLGKFDTISEIVEDSLFNAIAQKIDEDDENEELIAIMEQCISISDTQEKLKYQYSNYVASYCISQVNEEIMDNFEALTLMRSAFLHTPNNPKICKNFITLIRFNLMDIINNRTGKANEIYKILDWVKDNVSGAFTQNSNELTNARKEIIDQLKSSGADISLFEEDEVSPFGTIFKKPKVSSHESLNAHGLKIKRVLSYFRSLGSSDNIGYGGLPF